MQLVCVSRGNQERGRLFAQDLARNLAFQCLDREEVAELAIREGIAVGKLETAVVKKRELNAREVLEKEHFLAFATRVVCERVLERNIVYHGRAGHFAVPMLTHALRIRTEIDPDTQIDDVMLRLSLERAKAKKFVETVDDDIKRWVRTMYGVGGDPSEGYDLVVNLDRVGVEGASTALCGYAQLPNFQATPATTKLLENLVLSTRVRIALARDERTWAARFMVRADDGHVTISYLPRDAAIGVRAPDVVETVAGVKGLSATMAASNILWIEDRFQLMGPTFEAVAKVAKQWHAAVELMRLTPQAAAASPAALDTAAVAAASSRTVPLFTSRQLDGGIEDDIEPSQAATGEDDVDLRGLFGELNARGIAGSASRMVADMARVGAAVDRSIPYSLVVVGDVFLDREPATRIRKTRELVGRLGDAVKAPVVNAEDLGQMVHAGWSYYLKNAALAVIVAAIFLVVFTFQKEVLEFLSPTSTIEKAVAAAALLVFVPIFATLYGTLTKSILGLFNVE